MGLINQLLELLNNIFNLLEKSCPGHSGGVATCCEKAICDNCGLYYGDYDLTNHVGNSEIFNSTTPLAECMDGYSGDLYCLSCNTIISYGYVIHATEPHYWITKYIWTSPKHVQKTCAQCQEIKIFELLPLDIQYIGRVDNKLYFKAINAYSKSYTKLIYSYTTSSGLTASNTQGAEAIPLYEEGVIITITIFEYTNNYPNDKRVFRKITKNFDTNTNTWLT